MMSTAMVANQMSVTRRTALAAVGAVVLGNVVLSATAAHGSTSKGSAVTLIEVTSLGLGFYSGSTLVDEFNYFDDGANSVLPALRSALGRGEKIKEVEGGNHPSYRLIAWDGLAVLDFKRSSGSLLLERFSIDVSSSRSSGVKLQAAGGIVVGTPRTQLDRGQYPIAEDAVTGAVNFHLDALDLGPESRSAPHDAQLFISALVDEASTVTRLRAPQTSWGV